MPHTQTRPSIAFSTVAALVVAGCLLAAAPARAADDVADVRALIASGDLASALERVDRALRERPRDPQARFVRGVVLMDLQRDDEAMAVFTDLAQEYPELADPPNNIALLHARAGRLEQARKALELALRNDPTHRMARANLGQVYLMLAVQAWEQAAAQGPLDVPLQRKLESARALLASVR